jgi:N-acetylmuramoyl-L-alanine amidase
MRAAKACFPPSFLLNHELCFRDVPAASRFAQSDPRQRVVLCMVLFVSEFIPDSSVVAEIRASPNHGERKASIDMLVLHYTGMTDQEAAIRHLCEPKSEVSAHYVVLEDGRITQCVPEARRAWHAGLSSWAGATDINSCSIGIEIANPGHDHGYPDYPRRQIAAVTALCRGIFVRHRIPADRVLGHSDVAPARKNDPGEKFPWKTLYQSGVGLWVEPAPIVKDGPTYVVGDSNPAIRELQELLARYGYGIEPSGQLDSPTREVIIAFQRHFRPALVDGVADLSTLETLRALLAARDAARARR